MKIGTAKRRGAGGEGRWEMAERVREIAERWARLGSLGIWG